MVSLRRLFLALWASLPHFHVGGRFSSYGVIIAKETQARRPQAACTLSSRKLFVGNDVQCRLHQGWRQEGAYPELQEVLPWPKHPLQQRLRLCEELASALHLLLLIDKSPS